MDDLLREAIADAKAVRETALANAKIALEEAFTPRLKSMLSRKIESEMDQEEMEDEEEMREEEDAEERMDADEMEQDAEEMKMDADEMRHDAEEMEDKEESEDAEESEDEMSEQEDAEEEEEMDEAEDAEEEDELDLESVLAELEADLNKDEEDELDEVEDKDEEEKVDENDVSSQIGSADNKVNPEAGDTSKVGQGPESEGSDKESGKELGDHDVVKESEDKEEEEDAEEADLDLDEVLRALTEEEDAEEEADKVDELKKEIKETRSVVKYMRAKLNEVNLLNAKLLFSNKLFRAFGLNNQQKLKVVENFDRTTNLREVKLVYATLAESFKRPSKLSESVVKGSRSKPVRSTKPAKQEVLSEGHELKARFKKLANIL